MILSATSTDRSTVSARPRSRRRSQQRCAASRARGRRSRARSPGRPNSLPPRTRMPWRSSAVAHRPTSSTPSSTSTKFACDGCTREARRASSSSVSAARACGDLRAARARTKLGCETAAQPGGERGAVDVERLLHEVEQARDVRVGDRVAEPQAGQPEDLRERADARSPGARRARRPDAPARSVGIGEVDVGLVGDHDAVGRQPVEERRPVRRARSACRSGCWGRRSRRAARASRSAASAIAVEIDREPGGRARA